MAKHKKFEIRKSPVDGRFRKWELRWASALFGELPEGTRDHLVPVVTGVYRSRKDVFREFNKG